MERNFKNKDIRKNKNKKDGIKMKFSNFALGGGGGKIIS